jgi:putative two-component system response regulator
MAAGAMTVPLRVLIVDDDPQVRNLLVRVLASFEAEIEQAASVAEALRHIESTRFDLILLDLHLPDRDGYAVLAQMRTNVQSRLVPILMLTGESSQREKLIALRAGANGFITKPFDSEEISARVQALLRLKAATDTLEDAQLVVVALARVIDARNPYTLGHSERVSHYAGLLGERAGLSEDDLTHVTLGSLLHDLGKVAVRDDVLLKCGPLTTAERAEMAQHTVIGRNLLGPMRTMSAILPIVYHHHERLDGSGYPAGLKGDEIPRIVRIVSIADVFDALTTPRPYRLARSPEETMQLLRTEAREGWWDAALVAEFAAAVELLPSSILGAV